MSRPKKWVRHNFPCPNCLRPAAYSEDADKCRVSAEQWREAKAAHDAKEE